MLREALKFRPEQIIPSDYTPHAAYSRRKHASLLLARATIAAAGTQPNHNTTVISPVMFGANPTGMLDSSSAFDETIEALLDCGTKSRIDPDGRIDLGGGTIDLVAGIYLIARSVSIPPGYANFRLQAGTLVASNTFPTDEYMLQIGGQCMISSTDCNSNDIVAIQQMALDGANVAYRGIVVNHTANVNNGPPMLVVG